MIPSIGTPQIHIEMVQPAPERIGRAAMSISNLDNHGPCPPSWPTKRESQSMLLIDNENQNLGRGPRLTRLVERIRLISARGRIPSAERAVPTRLNRSCRPPPGSAAATARSCSATSPASCPKDSRQAREAAKLARRAQKRAEDAAKSEKSAAEKSAGSEESAEPAAPPQKKHPGARLRPIAKLKQVRGLKRMK